MSWLGVIEKYRQFLPVNKETPVVTLLEGNTPLIEAKYLPQIIDGKVKIYFKLEGLNPTGSFKDRGMTLAISKAKEEDAKAVICASTGNTSASAAAYAAAAGLKCIVLVPKDNIARGKLSQALIHGAQVIMLEGNFDQALNIVKTISSQFPITLVNSINPYRLEGQKTAAYEICDVLEEAPDIQAIPVGNAGNITAYWRGYKEYKEQGKIKNLPKMFGFQAAGAAPIVEGKIIENPKTVATAIRIGNPANWEGALRAKEESDGLIDKVSDEEILSAYKIIAQKEGIFVEPASAASVAGILKLNQKGYFSSKSLKIVCIITGQGLKDPDCVERVISEPITLPPKLDKVLKFLELR